jgi:hypothetical protein
MNKTLLNIRTGAAKEINIDYDFWSAPSFSHGVECVCREIDGETKLALINKDFELITDFIFDSCEDFSEGLAAVEIAEKWGYIDISGEIVIEPQFQQACDFEHGLAQIQDITTDKYAFINKIGELVTDYYDHLGFFGDGFVCAQNTDSETFSFLNENGEVAFTRNYSDSDLNKFTLDEISSSWHTSCGMEDVGLRLIDDDFYSRDNLAFCKFYDGLCQFVERTDNGTKIGFFDKSGSITIPAEFDFVSRFCDGIAFYSNGKNIYDCKSGILTTAGERIEIGDFIWAVCLDKSCNLFPVRANKRDGKPNANGKYGFVDRSGKFVTAPQFDIAHPPVNGMASVFNGYKIGFVNEDGEYVIPAQHDIDRCRTHNFDEYGLGVVAKFGEFDNSKYGVIDKAGNVVVPLIYDDLEVLSEDRLYAKIDDNGYRLLNFDGTPVNDEYFGRIGTGGVFDEFVLVDTEPPKSESETSDKIFRADCREGNYLYFYECYPGCAESHGHGFGIMKEDGTILTHQIFEHIGSYFDGLIFGQSLSRSFDYINLDGEIELFNFPDICSEFVDGVARIATHDECEAMYNYTQGVTLKNPIVDNITTFFMNKQGDIVQLSLKEQRDFRVKMAERFEQKSESKRWEFEEFVK